MEEARSQVAALIGAAAADIVFTSSGTEADNLAVVGGMLAARKRGRHGLVSSIEHHAVLGAASLLRTLGYSVDEGATMAAALSVCSRWNRACNPIRR